MKKLLLVLPVLLVSGCSWFSQDKVNNARDVVKTFDDLGQRGCEIFYADTYGVSFEDAAKFYCTDERVKRFRDQFLAGAKSTEEAMGSKPPNEME